MRAHMHARERNIKTRARRGGRQAKSVPLPIGFLCAIRLSHFPLLYLLLSFVTPHLIEPSGKSSLLSVLSHTYLKSDDCFNGKLRSVESVHGPPRDQQTEGKGRTNRRNMCTQVPERSRIRATSSITYNAMLEIVPHTIHRTHMTYRLAYTLTHTTSHTYTN